MKNLRLLVVFSVLFALSLSVKAQNDYKMQSLFVFNFTRMIAWPQDYTSGDFVIGIYGNSPIVSEFNDLAAARTVGSQKIVVKQFSSIAEIQKCHVIYVPGNQARHIADINQKLIKDDISAMIVSDHENALRNGAVVNFVVEGNRQRYELSERNANILGLHVGGEMARLAVAVK